MGFPILVKAVMGGGGKGMKLAAAAGELLVRSVSAGEGRMHLRFTQRVTKVRCCSTLAVSTEPHGYREEGSQACSWLHPAAHICPQAFKRSLHIAAWRACCIVRFVCRRPYSQQRERRLHPLAMTACCWSASSSGRATLRSKSLPTRTTMQSTCLSGTAACSDVIKRYIPLLTVLPQAPTPHMHTIFTNCA